MARNMIISILCGAKAHYADYLSCEGMLCNKCKQDRHCDIMNLSNDQIKYIVSDVNSDFYLNACPGSGKTEVVGVKCAYELNLWNNKVGGFAVLTFTNSAENELHKRVTSYYKKQLEYPHFLGTFTSWILGYIANPFLYLITGHGNGGSEDSKIQIIDKDCKSAFLDAFKTHYQYDLLHRIAANEYFFDTKINSYRYCGCLREGKFVFDSCLSRSYMLSDLRSLKQKFWKAGFFLYEDIDSLTIDLLNHFPKIAELVAKRFPLIVVDECQDLSYSQLQILDIIHQSGSRIHLIGDLDQAIYDFRNIEPIDTYNFIKRNHLHELNLNENFRSNQLIVEATRKIINKADRVFGKIPPCVNKPLIVFLYRKNQESVMIKNYLNILQQENLQLNNCRIIVRNTALKAKLLGRNSLLQYNNSINIIEDYANFVYLHNNKTEVSDFQKSIQLLARAIQKSFFENTKHDNLVGLHRPMDVNSSDWYEIILLFQEAILSNTDVLNLNQKWGEWKQKLNYCLSGVSHHSLSTFDLKRLRNGIKDTLVINYFKDNNESIENKELLIETIHGCKGMSLESALLVSSYSQTQNFSGSHWRDWFFSEGESVGEAQRLAYVAFSRAKHLLALGIPNPVSSPISKEEKDGLKLMGFNLYDCDSNMWID